MDSGRWGGWYQVDAFFLWSRCVVSVRLVTGGWGGRDCRLNHVLVGEAIKVLKIPAWKGLTVLLSQSSHQVAGRAPRQSPFPIHLLLHAPCCHCLLDGLTWSVVALLLQVAVRPSQGGATHPYLGRRRCGSLIRRRQGRLGESVYCCGRANPKNNSNNVNNKSAQTHVVSRFVGIPPPTLPGESSRQRLTTHRTLDPETRGLGFEDPDGTLSEGYPRTPSSPVTSLRCAPAHRCRPKRSLARVDRWEYCQHM